MVFVIFFKAGENTMRKIFLTAAVSGIISILSAASSVPGKVTANILNMRLTPSLQSAVAGKIRNGQALAITAARGMWLEVQAPDSVKVYVDEAYISNGKTLRELTMYAGMSRKAAAYGKLPKGTDVQVTKERGWGWVRIKPPQSLKVYVANAFVSYDADALAKVMEENKSKAAEAARTAPAVKEEKKVEKPAEKPAVKEEKPAEKPAVREEKPAEKPAGKPAVKEEKKVEKPAAKPAVKEEKKADKPVILPAPVKKSAPAPFRADDPRVKALQEYGVDVMKEKPQPIVLEGHLLRIPSSVNIATNYAIGGDNRKNLGFVCAEEDGMLSPFVDQRVKITGRKFTIKGWKAPIVWLDEIDKVK